MEYEIVITKREKNPNYTPKKPYEHYQEEVEFYLSQKVLSVVATEEEFKAIKKACLEVM